METLILLTIFTLSYWLGYIIGKMAGLKEGNKSTKTLIDRL
jgi:hypothetical protein